MFTTIVIYTLLAIIGWQFYNKFLKLFINVWYYSKQGLSPDVLLPIVGMPFHILKRDIPTHGDPFYTAKQALKKNPDKKFYIGNFSEHMVMFITDPVIAREFYTEKRKFYNKDTPMFELWNNIIPYGMITIEGNLWKKHRRVISELFHFDFVKTMIPNIKNVCEDNWNRIEKTDLNNVDVMELFQNITGSVVCKLFLGVDIAATHSDLAITKRLSNLVNTLMVQRINPLCVVFGGKVIKLGLTKTHREILDDFKWFNEFGRNILARKRDALKIGESVTSKGLFDLILERNEREGQQHSEHFSDQEMLDEFLTFFIAGTDTTGHLLAFIAHNIIKYPEWTQKIREEISTHITGNLSEVNMETLNKMEVLNAFIKETLRLAPPAPLIFDVKADQPHTLGGINIKPGTLVSVLIEALQVHPKYYKEPESFRPERWLNAEEMKQIDPFVDIGFSAGQRNCIGQHFAKMEAKLVIISLLQRYDLEFSMSDYDLKTTMKFILEPRETLYINLKPRI